MPISNMAKLNFTGAERDALDELAIVLKQKWPSITLKIFGSKVHNTTDTESDIDLLIVLPCSVTTDIRRWIVHMIFEVNLKYETNISGLIISDEEWQGFPLSLLPIHDSIESEGIAL